MKGSRPKSNEGGIVDSGVRLVDHPRPRIWDGLSLGFGAFRGGYWKRAVTVSRRSAAGVRVNARRAHAQDPHCDRDAGACRLPPGSLCSNFDKTIADARVHAARPPIQLTERLCWMCLLRAGRDGRREQTTLRQRRLQLRCGGACHPEGGHRGRQYFPTLLRDARIATSHHVQTRCCTQTRHSDCTLEARSCTMTRSTTKYL